MQGKSWYFSHKGRVEGPFTREQLKLRVKPLEGFLIWNPSLSQWKTVEEIFGEEFSQDIMEPLEQMVVGAGARRVSGEPKATAISSKTAAISDAATRSPVQLRVRSRPVANPDSFEQKSSGACDQGRTAQGVSVTDLSGQKPTLNTRATHSDRASLSDLANSEGLNRPFDSSHHRYEQEVAVAIKQLAQKWLTLEKHQARQRVQLLQSIIDEQNRIIQGLPAAKSTADPSTQKAIAQLRARLEQQGNVTPLRSEQSLGYASGQRRVNREKPAHSTATRVENVTTQPHSSSARPLTGTNRTQVSRQHKTTTGAPINKAPQLEVVDQSQGITRSQNVKTSEKAKTSVRVASSQKVPKNALPVRQNRQSQSLVSEAAQAGVGQKLKPGNGITERPTVDTQVRGKKSQQTSRQPESAQLEPQQSEAREKDEHQAMMRRVLRRRRRRIR
jgi:hypothetical protein